MRYIVIFCCLLILASCEHDSPKINDEYIELEAMSGSVPMTAEGQNLIVEQSDDRILNKEASLSTKPKNRQPNQPMLLKTGSMSIEVEDLHTAKSTLDSIITNHQGYYQSDVLHQGVNHSSYELTVRLPVTQYDQIPQIVKSLGKVTHKAIQVHDVTKDYHDLELRLGHHEAYLRRYVEILDRADSIKDVLTIQERIRVLEEEVESKKGQMRHMKHQATYSTLHLTLDHHHPQVAQAESQHFGHEIASAFISGFNGLLGLIIGLISIWPVLLTLSWIGIWFYKKQGGRMMKYSSEHN